MKTKELKRYARVKQYKASTGFGVVYQVKSTRNYRGYLIGCTISSDELEGMIKDGVIVTIV